MVSRKTVIVNEEGFHMRAAADFVKVVSEFQSDITVSSVEKSANGKSIMLLMAAGFKRGTEVEVTCEGEDEIALLEKACGLIDAGLGDE